MSTLCGLEQQTAAISRCICRFCFFYAIDCSTSYSSFSPLQLQLPNYLTYSAGGFERIQNKNLAGFMPLIHVLWYIEKYLVN